MEKYWQGKFWQAMQLNLLVRKTLTNKLVSAYPKYIFGVNIGKENFGK